MASKVFVGNLDFNTTREDLEALMSQAGQVKDVYLPTDRETRRPRGFAFVEYSSDEEAAANGYPLLTKYYIHFGIEPIRIAADKYFCLRLGCIESEIFQRFKPLYRNFHLLHGIYKQKEPVVF